MNCLSEEELIDYLFSEDSAARAKAEAHFPDCEGCRARMEAFKQVKAAAASLSPAPVSADFTARLMQRLEKRPSAPGLSGLWPFFRLLGPAWGYSLAAFAAAVCFFAFFLTGPRSRPASPAEALYFSDGPATVNSGLRAPAGIPAGRRAGYVYTDDCETAKCGIL